MNWKTIIVSVAIGGVFAASAFGDEQSSKAVAGPYRATWESLQAHKDPEWFCDAKFGIYTHWGPVTVGSEDSPSGGQWYGREMYDRQSPVFAYHQRHFGDQAKVGYKDIIPKFTAEKFDAEIWAELFARSGAKFAGPVAVHHDNFAMWDSQVTPWNAVKMGPHRDVTGELEKAIKRRGLKFITTFHHGFAWQYFEPSFAFDGADPRSALLYTEAHKPGAPPSKVFLDQWLAMVNEVVDKYQPDMIWFDFELNKVITPEYQRRMFADYYNWAARHDRGSAVAHKFREIHKFTGILDFERGREDRLVPYPWLTDTALAEWFNQKSAPYRSIDNLIDVFVDIVAKNGCMLLDVSPAADGSIPTQAQTMLRAMGDWLQINGEAIYATRPWLVYGEGPTRSRGGVFSENGDRPFGPKDIRFTTKGDALYAIALDWPPEGKLLIRSLALAAGKVTAVNLLGQQDARAWKQTDQGLEIMLPGKKPCEYAFALKVLGTGLKPSSTALVAPPVKPDRDGLVLLEPAAAQLHGNQVRVEQQNGHEYIAAWDKSDDWISWNIDFPAATYEVSIVYTAAYADTDFVVDLAGQKLDGKAEKTSGWFDYRTLNLGTLTVAGKGVAELAVRAKTPSQWQALNVREIRLKPRNAAAVTKISSSFLVLPCLSD